MWHGRTQGTVRTRLVISLAELLLGVLKGAGCKGSDLRSQGTGKMVSSRTAQPEPADGWLGGGSHVKAVPNFLKLSIVALLRPSKT